MGSDSFSLIPTYTDANGNMKFLKTFLSDQAFDMSFEDIDGAQNGSFQALDTIVEFVDPPVYWWIRQLG